MLQCTLSQLGHRLQCYLFVTCRQLSNQMKVTTLTYSNSIEETQFLTTTKREIKAFEDLIEEKENIAKRPDLKTAVSSDTAQPIVLIDTREFRSDLPAMIYRNGFKLEPAMLDVGDYILTPSIVVERKSLMDLIGSLRNGRLYTQLCSMKESEFELLFLSRTL